MSALTRKNLKHIAEYLARSYIVPEPEGPEVQDIYNVLVDHYGNLYRLFYDMYNGKNISIGRYVDQKLGPEVVGVMKRHNTLISPGTSQVR